MNIGIGIGHLIKIIVNLIGLKFQLHVGYLFTGSVPFCSVPQNTNILKSLLQKRGFLSMLAGDVVLLKDNALCVAHWSRSKSIPK